tara:strand:- start:606 stop:1139 length:534 start_codon:yes stop_codon:yes gene_type:complete
MKIFGYIKDITTGAPMPFVNLAREGSGIGTTTNMEGFFTLEGANLTGNWEFTITHIGYTPVKLKASEMQGGTIYLNPSSTAIGEVVINEPKYRPPTPTTRPTSWLDGLKAGLGLNTEQPNPNEVPIINPGAPTPQPTTPPYTTARYQEKTNPLVWVGLGVGVLAILVVVIVASKGRR